MSQGMGTDELEAVLAGLQAMVPTGSDAERIDRLRLLEQLKGAVAGAQMREAVEFAASQEVAAERAGVSRERRSRGVAGQVALARAISPWAAARWLGQARILTSELPATFAQLKSGRTTEWRALLVARETVFLSREDRAQVDADIAPKLPTLGDRTVASTARLHAQRLDPAGSVERIRRAESERRVSIRPAVDAMAYLTALVPMAQGVAAYAALSRAADLSVVGCQTSAQAPRSRGQVMTDTLIERLTGQQTADAVPVRIELVMSDQALFGGPDSDQPGLLDGQHPIPASFAREIALSAGAPRWIRRLYIAPDDGQLVAMESRSRDFTPAQRDFLRLRDGTCRTPWCGAPIRHADHVLAHADGGPTAVGNGQGLCTACNHAKQAPGWSARATPDGDVVTRTPTGHRYVSHAPPALPPPAPPLGLLRPDGVTGEDAIATLRAELPRAISYLRQLAA